MKHLIFPVCCALFVALCWGLYGPTLTNARSMDKPPLWGPFKPYVFIGVAYLVIAIIGGGIMMKVAGPQLLARKKYEIFAILARMTVLAALLLVPLICGAVIPFGTGLALDYGANACTFANDSQCVPFFTNVFGENATGGQYTLPFTFDAFAYGASIEAVFFVIRATLLATLDLDYMVYGTIIGVIVYIPAICVATLVPPFGGQAISYFIAMYVPQVFLIFVFLYRLCRNINRMLNGLDGPWIEEGSVQGEIASTELPEQPLESLKTSDESECAKLEDKVNAPVIGEEQT